MEYSFSTILWFILIITYIVKICYLSIQYNATVVPEINSSNNILDSSSLFKIIEHFKIKFKLTEYEVLYTNTGKFKNIFSGLNKKKKQIIISKRLFNSIGYEIDYIVSRLWIAKKQLEKDGDLFSYKFFIYLSTFFKFLFVLLFFVQQIIQYIYKYKFNSQIELSDWYQFISFLLNFNILFLMGMIIYIIYLINMYYITSKLKKNLELKYTCETLKEIKEFIIEYEYDFIAARRYSSSIIISKMEVIGVKKKIESWNWWLGPFVIY